MLCWEMIAEGRVQGVGYRWYVQNCALKHGIKGFVKNLSDGSVKVVAIGAKETLEIFADEVKRGNHHALIKQLSVSELTQYTDYKEFVIV